MLESHTRQIDTTAIKRAGKKEKKRTTKRKQNRSAALGRPARKSLAVGGWGGGLQLVCGRQTLCAFDLFRPVKMAELPPVWVRAADSA